MLPLNINPAYQNRSFLKQFFTSYRNTDTAPLIDGGCRLLKLPFTCAILEDFLHPNPLCLDPKRFTSVDELVDKAESEARRLTFEHRSNDLFTFNQSIDIANLAALEFPLLSDIRSFLLETVLPWLEKLTGTTLEKDKVDFTSSLYKNNDVLLCHDDELDSRRIAFVWYLVPNDWNACKEGGCLDLFSCRSEELPSPPSVTNNLTDSVHPWKVSVSIPPKRNMFVFFEPSAFSFHQVSEVIGTRDRLSLHGWFHGSPLPRPSLRHHPTLPPLVSPVGVEEDLVYRLINPIYLDMRQQAKIRRRFINSSEIQLAHFLRVEEWHSICCSLAQLDNSAWYRCGPFNRKNYDMFTGLGSEDASETLHDLYRLFRSEAMLVILSDLTGIRLHPRALLTTLSKGKENDTEPMDAKRSRLGNDGHDDDAPATDITVRNDGCVAKISEPQCRRWTLGSYTLLADSDVVDTTWRLECILHLAGYGQQTSESRMPAWQSAWGGQLVYIAANEPDELLSVIPSDNALTLVYTGPGTASFVKYINHSARPSPLGPLPTEIGSSTIEVHGVYDLAVVFHEPCYGSSNAVTGFVTVENGDFSEVSETDSESNLESDGGQEFLHSECASE